MQLLRIFALLLLICVSSGRAASLIHARQALEETEAPAVIKESPTEEQLAADSPAAEASVVNDPVAEAPAEDSLPADLPVAADSPLNAEADASVQEEALVADSPVQSEAQDMPAGDPHVAAADEAVPGGPSEDAPAGEAAMETPEDAAAAVDVPAAEEGPGDASEDKMAADAPADTMMGDAPADDTIGDAPAEDTMAADAPEAETMVDEGPAEDTMVGDEVLTAQADAAVEGMAADMPVDSLIAADAPAENIPADVNVDGFPEAEEEDIMSPLPPSVHTNAEGDWGVNTIRQSFQAVNGYFDSLVELMGGRNGVCQYRCRYGKTPYPRVGYILPEPNGCSSSLLGFELDLGIPAMTKCCNQLDVCYDTCGSNKNRCDSKFRWCLHGICSELKKSLGFVSKVEVCESMADAMYNTVWTLGCRSYMSSQRAACFCEGEERDEL